MVRPPQTVDKTKVFRQIDESFGQAFSKACAVEAAEASSRSAERDTPLSAFLFANFFFAPSSCKEKVANAFVHCYKLCAFGLHAEEQIRSRICSHLCLCYPKKKSEISIRQKPHRSA